MKRRWLRALSPLSLLLATFAWNQVGCGKAETPSSSEKRYSPLPSPTPPGRSRVTPIPRLPE